MSKQKYTKEELLNNSEVRHKELPGYPRYIVNENGEVFHTHWRNKGIHYKKSKGFFNKTKKRWQYEIFNGTKGLCTNAARLVMLAFNGPCPDGLEVCHNDGDSTNNRLSNLRYDTHQNNMDDKFIHGTVKQGEGIGNSKLKEEDVYEIKKLIKNGIDIQTIASYYNMSEGPIYTIENGRTWKDFNQDTFIPRRKKKILITGGAGYIAGKLVDILLAAGYTVAVYDNLTYEDRYMKDVEFIFGDIRETDRLVSIASNFDKVVWAAALVGENACSLNPEITREINFLSLERFCNKLPKEVELLHISTCSVYGQNDSLLTEESPVKPLSDYAATKLLSESPVLKRRGICVRLGTVYGQGDCYARPRFDLVANILIAKAWKYKEIHINGGHQKRPIISVHDIVGYLYEWCRRDDIPSGIYILSSENVTLKELGHRIAKYFGGKIKIIENEMNMVDTRNYMVDNSKALKTFNFKPSSRLRKETRWLKKVLIEGRIKDFEDPIYHNGSYLNFKKGRNEFK